MTVGGCSMDGEGDGCMVWIDGWMDDEFNGCTCISDKG